MTTNLSVAIIDTGVHRLVATGATPREAVDAVMAAWQKLSAEVDLCPDWVVRSDVEVLTGALGQAFHEDTPYPTHRDAS